MYRVMLVEKDRLMLEKLSAVIERTPNFSMAVRYQSKQDALGQGRMFDPNLILLDIDNENAISLIESFHQSYPNADILGMAAEWRPESATHLLGAGARGCLIKPFTGVELQEAVREFVTEGSEKDCETLVFFSPKGKSGKTTLIANLAEAQERSSRAQVVMLVARAARTSRSASSTLTCSSATWPSSSTSRRSRRSSRRPAMSGFSPP